MHTYTVSPTVSCVKPGGRTPPACGTGAIARCGLRVIACSGARRRVASVSMCECIYQTTMMVSSTQTSMAVVTASAAESAAHAGTRARHGRSRLGKWWSVEIQASATRSVQVDEMPRRAYLQIIGPRLRSRSFLRVVRREAYGASSQGAVPHTSSSSNDSRPAAWRSRAPLSG